MSKCAKKSRVFKVCITLPPDCNEDQMMDYIEDAVVNHRFKDGPDKIGAAYWFDKDLVVVKRATQKYYEMAGSTREN